MSVRVNPDAFVSAIEPLPGFLALLNSRGKIASPRVPGHFGLVGMTAGGDFTVGVETDRPGQFVIQADDTYRVAFYAPPRPGWRGLLDRLRRRKPELLFAGSYLSAQRGDTITIDSPRR